MRGVWLLAVLGLAGCSTTPKRELRQPITEEIALPPAGTYNNPPDIPRDSPLLSPKTAPSLNPGGPGGPGGGMTPGGGMQSPGGPPGTGVRR